MTSHVANAKMELDKAQQEVRTGNLDPVEAAMIAVLAANAEATLALVEQQRICNETTLYAEAAYEKDNSHTSSQNPTGMTVADWAHDLYGRIRE